MRNSLIIISFLVFSACNSATEKPLDTPTSGVISIAVDETLQPILEAELDVFASEYPRTGIKAAFKTEVEAITDVLNDSVRIAIISRKLSTDEKAIFKAIKVNPREILFAHDALALIVNRSNYDTLMTMPELKMLLKGNVLDWNKLDGGNLNQSIAIVVDNEASSTVRFLQDSVLGGESIFKGIYALKSNAEVISYVKANKGALGIIGVNWISDTDDSTANSFMNDIRVIRLQNETDKEYYTPQQAYIALKKYPLSRKVFAILREPRTGLGTGFSNFLTSDKGQRVILKSGLVPATMPIRLIQTKKKTDEF